MASPSPTRGPGPSRAEAAQGAVRTLRQGLQRRRAEMPAKEPLPRRAGQREEAATCGVSFTTRAEPRRGPAGAAGPQPTGPPGRLPASVYGQPGRKGACTPRHTGRRPRGPATRRPRGVQSQARPGAGLPPKG